MRHFRAEEERGTSQGQEKLPFDQRLRESLGAVTRLLSFVELTVNYGYAIENVWVTMLMIEHGLSDEVDSFVWVVPIAVAILIRPYIVRYVHHIDHKVYRQIAVVSLFLAGGGLGCFMVGWSCSMTGKRETLKRLVVSSVGWTVMDLSFEFCQFFAEKIEESYRELRQELRKDREDEEEVEGHQREQQGEGRKEGGWSHGLWTNKQNFQFYGLCLGYVVSLMICWIVQGRTVKQFYRCCKYAYWSVGVLAIITGLRLHLESFLRLPKRDDHQDKGSALRAMTLSTNASFYLPGLMELLRADRRTLVLLGMHGLVLFVNDVVMIYATMWFSQPADYRFDRKGQALIAGLEYGSVALLFYTIVDFLKVDSKYLHFLSYFQGALTLTAVLSCYAWFSYSYVGFAFVCIWVGVLNQFYRHVLYNREAEDNALFERCLQLTERGQKVAVLCIMPAIILLGLGRDDIRDCLLWAAALALLGLLLCRLSLKAGPGQETSNGGRAVSRRVSKIE